MKPPHYFTTELAHRIAAGMLSKDELDEVFETAGIDITAEVGPDPDFEGLVELLRLRLQFVRDEDVVDLDVRMGTIELEATLGLLGRSQPLLLRLAYASAKQVAVSEWHVLVWRSQAAPEWVPVPAALFDTAVVDAASQLIAADALLAG